MSEHGMFTIPPQKIDFYLAGGETMKVWIASEANDAAKVAAQNPEDYALLIDLDHAQFLKAEEGRSEKRP